MYDDATKLDWAAPRSGLALDFEIEVELLHVSSLLDRDRDGFINTNKKATSAAGPQPPRN